MIRKYRHEIKHYINIADYLAMKNRLRAVMSLDRNADEKGQYKIRSLYFDNLEDTALLEKFWGINHREKFRIRFYNNNLSFIKLEKKSKSNGLTSKQNTRLSADECSRIIKGDISWLRERDNPLLNELYIKMNSGLYRPKTVVDYIREAYIYPPGNVRVTIDKSVKSGLNSVDLFNVNLPLVETLDSRYIILEVKFDEYLPQIITDIIQTNERRAAAISKYALARIYG